MASKLIGIFIVTIISYLIIYNGLNVSKLTQKQKATRDEILYIQTFLLFTILILSTLFLVENQYQNIVPVQYWIYGLAVITFIIYIYYAFKIEDNKKVNARLETVFSNLKPIKYKVKKIKDYAHYFGGIKKIEGYAGETIDIDIMVTEIELKEYRKKLNNEMEMNDFYYLLDEYLNKKLDELGVDVSRHGLNDQSIYSHYLYWLEMVNMLTKKSYYISLSQLSQKAVTQMDLDFLIFLQDCQHNIFSSRGLKNAVIYLGDGLKDE